MKIKLSLKNGVALLFLSFVMQETHEIAHTATGRIICGCWGKRNFNLWTLCSGCADEKPLSILATFAGPFYSFLVIWTGYFLMLKPSPKIKSIGFALIVSSMPFSRILTPIFGGGDEVYALNTLWNNHSLAWVVSVILVFALAIPPVVKVWNTIENRKKIVWFVGLILAPFIATGIVVFGVFQSLLLENGVLNDYGVLGSPILITLWSLCCVLICVVFGKSLTTLLQPVSTKVSLGSREC